jgi:hypothetical protein
MSPDAAGRDFTTIEDVPLLERDREYATLQSQWSRAQAGQGGLVIVTGRNRREAARVSRELKLVD